MRKAIRGIAWILLSILSINSRNSRADASGTSTSSLNEAPRLLDKLYFNYWGNYGGPSIGTPSSLEVNSKGVVDPGLPQQMDTMLVLGYKLSENVSVGPFVEFHYRPVFGQDIQMNEPAILVRDRKIFASAHVVFGGDFLLFSPGASPWSRQTDFLTGGEAIHITTYTIGNLTLGLYGFFRANAFGSYVPGTPQYDLRIYGAPNLSYNLTRNVQFTVWNDLVSLRHFLGTSGLVNDPIDVEPGINWNVTPYLSLNPYVNIYSETPTLRAMYLGMVLTGTIPGKLL